MSRRNLAERFSVNTATITRLLQRQRPTGSCDPRPNGGGVEPILDDEALGRLRALVEEAPDATLELLKQSLGISGSRMIVCPGLQKLGLPRKKSSKHAAERDSPEVQKKRRECRKVMPIEPNRLVFVDETGVATAMTPTRGRAPSGERVESSTPASWKSATVVAALGLEGVRAPLVLPGSVDAVTIESYVEQVLVPALRRVDVVVFDNLSSHLGPAVIESIERAGACVLPSPPDSLDFTPIMNDRTDPTSSDK